MPHKSAILVSGILALFAAVALGCLWILPAPHRPLHYMLAGTFATAVILVLTLLWCAVVFHSARRNGPQS